MIGPDNEFYDLFVGGNKDYITSISVDNVIFGYHEKQLKVLLMRNPNFPFWMLAGGYLKKTESAEEAAIRVASLRTGLKDLFLQQFKVFSTPGRNLDPHITPEILGRLMGREIDENHWFFDRAISISFYTLTDFSKVVVSGSYLGEECQWWDIKALPLMFMDHKGIIAEALSALRLHIYHYPIGYELLPDKFTLPEIRTLYETILEKELDDRNFSKKLLAAGIIGKLDEIKKIKGHRSPFLYKFNRRVYLDALKAGMLVL